MAAGAAQSGLGRVDQRWREYVERIQGRDPSALQALYDETSRVLYSLASRVLNDREDAEEVILDVYQQVWNSADRSGFRAPDSRPPLHRVLCRAISRDHRRPTEHRAPRRIEP
jgi:DNA-directed RNA polymerase specialized sigma24 family protein